MARLPLASLAPFLLLLFIQTLANSALIPFMGFFLIDALGHPPWMLSVYSGLAVSLTVTANRAFGRRIDAGARVFPLIGLAASGYLIATLSLSLSPTLPVMLTLGVIGLGLSSSAISTMFSFGGHLAEGRQIDRSRFNAYMRATTSTAWMIGPAMSFLVADWLGPAMVFRVALGLSLIWLALWWISLPRDASAGALPAPAGTPMLANANTGLWLATAFVFCLSVAHALTFSALPLFYVQEVGLPDFAPGAAFSVKTFVEVFAIFSTPALMARFGTARVLLATTGLAIGTILFLSSITTLPQMILGAAMEGLYYGLFASLGISYVQSFARDRPAQATAIYWNTLMVSGLLAGPAVGLIAQLTDFQTVIQSASLVAAFAALVLLAGMRQRKPA